jgi:long-chain acyl-CoA synthetase
MAITDYLVTDDLTILLSLIAVTVFLLHNLYKPQPLVHPILLGRQSDVTKVRNQGESAVYRNYATGMLGRVRLTLLRGGLLKLNLPTKLLQFAVRPGKDVNILSDFIKPYSDPCTLWSSKVQFNYSRRIHLMDAKFRSLASN